MLMVAAVLACLPTAEMGPVQQQEFCTAIIEAEFAFAEAIGERNQVRRNNLVAETREARRAEIERLIGDGAIEDWEVIVARVTDHMVGGIKTPQLQLELGCDAVLLTVNDLNAARGYLAAI